MQVPQVQSAHTQLAQLSEHSSHAQLAWLQVGQVQSEQEQTPHESVQFEHWQVVHSS